MDPKKRAKTRKKIKELKDMCKAYRASLRVAEREINKLLKQSKKKMRKGGGATKGRAFENEIAKTVAKAFSDFGVTREDCYRTPLSGGHRFAKKEDSGDLVIGKKLKLLFPFHVECKFYKKIDLNPFFVAQKKWPKSWSVKAWLKQTTSSCKSDAIPMLVFKQNDQEVLCAIPGLYPLMTVVQPHLKFKYNGEEWYVARFDKVLRVMVKHAGQGEKDAG